MQRTPRFFPVSTRIGLTHPPIGKTEPNMGVEDAPAAIITNRFLSGLTTRWVDKFSFSKPEDIPFKKIWEVTARESKACIDLIASKLKPGETQVVVGGDNSVTFCSLVALLRSFENPSKIAHLHIDTHGDINSVKSSPSGNWHGMYLRPIFRDDFEIPQINELVPANISTDNLVFIGNCEFDGDEPELVKRRRIRVIDRRMLRSDNGDVTSAINNLLNRVEHVHMSIDIDAFDESIAPATGLPKKDGLFFEDLRRVFLRIKEYPSISFDVVEVNPKLEGAEKTVELAQKIIKTLLS